MSGKPKARTVVDASEIVFDDVPIPPPDREGRAAIYPFHRMEIGQSFLVKTTELARQQSVRNAAFNYAKRHRKRFVASKVNGLGIRVWRVQ